MDYLIFASKTEIIATDFKRINQDLLKSNIQYPTFFEQLLKAKAGLFLDIFKNNTELHNKILQIKSNFKNIILYDATHQTLIINQDNIDIWINSKIETSKDTNVSTISNTNSLAENNSTADQDNSLSFNRGDAREQGFRISSTSSHLFSDTSLQHRKSHVESMDLSNQEFHDPTKSNTISAAHRESPNQPRKILHTELSSQTEPRDKLVSELTALSKNQLLQGIYHRGIATIRTTLTQVLQQRELLASNPTKQSLFVDANPRGITNIRGDAEESRKENPIFTTRDTNFRGESNNTESTSYQKPPNTDTRNQTRNQESLSNTGESILSQREITRSNQESNSRDSLPTNDTRSNSASTLFTGNNRETQQDISSAKRTYDSYADNRLPNASTRREEESISHTRQGGISKEERDGEGLDFTQGNSDFNSYATPQTQETLLLKETNAIRDSKEGFGNHQRESSLEQSALNHGTMHTQANSSQELEILHARMGEEDHQQGELRGDTQGSEEQFRALFKPFPKNFLLKRNNEAQPYRKPYPIITGVKARIEANLKALQTATEILNNNRTTATQEEQEILASYSGFGGLKDLFYEEKYQDERDLLQSLVGENFYQSLKDSTLNAFYTPNFIIEAIFEGLKQAHVPFNEDTYKVQALEPSCGNGRFLSLAPNNFEWTCVELDPISATLTKLLHPNAKVYNTGLEQIEFSQEFDIVIGNPPYSDLKIQDYKSAGNGMLSSNYFVIKSTELLKENGILSFIINSGFLDSKSNHHRIFLSDNGKLLDAFRLPNSTFKQTNTQVLSDIIFYQKDNPNSIQQQKEDIENKKVLESFLNTQETSIERTSISCNEYFSSQNEKILGKLGVKSNPYGEQELFVREKENLQEQLKNVIAHSSLQNYYFELNPPRIEKRMEIPLEVDSSLSIGNLFFYQNQIYKKTSQEHCELAYFEEELTLDKLDSIKEEDRLEVKKNYFLYKQYLTQEEIKILLKVLEFRDLLKDNLQNERIMPNDEKSNAYILAQKTKLRAIREEILMLVKPKNKKLEECFFANNFKATEQRHSFHSLLKLESIDCYRVFATENIEKTQTKTRKITLSNILKTRICYPLEKTLASSPKEALQKTIMEKGFIHLETLISYLPSTEHLSNMDLKNVLKELLDSKLIYPNLDLVSKPAHSSKSCPLILKEEFLSGNLKSKYKQIKTLIKDKTSLEPLGLLKDLIDLETIAQDLKDSFPKDLEFNEITLNFGTSFIPAHIYEDFFKSFLLEPHAAQITMNLYNGTYSILNSIKDNGFPLDTKDFKPSAQEFRIEHLKKDSLGKEYYGGLWCDEIEFFNKVLANKSLEVYHYIEDPNDSKIKIKIPEIANTKKAMENAENLKFAFSEFFYANPKYCEEITQIYNDTLNVFGDKKLDYESFLETPYLNQDITLRPHQKNAVFKGVIHSSLMLDHQVGAGKTLACIAIAMEQKRMGLIHKALFLVPNHLSAQWGEEFLRAYPSANILVGDNIKSKKDRKEFLHRARYGDYDAIIMKHSTFENLKVLEENQIDNLRKALAELDTMIREKYKEYARINPHKTEKLIDKVFTRKKHYLQNKLEKLLNGKTYDKEISFEDLGIDALFVDEIQEFKNLYLLHSQDNVKGLPTLESQKASKMLVATNYMHEKGYKVYLATGTPISNSIAEMFVMQTYLQPNLLKELHLDYFDAWQRIFSSINTSEELDSTGVNFSIVNRLNSFVNVPELLSLYSQNADIITNQDIKRFNNNQDFLPQLEGGKPKNIILPRSELVASYIGIENQNGEFNAGSLCYRAEHLRDDLIENNMLKILNDGAKAALDFRLIRPNAPDFEHSKINACVKNILEIYRDSTYPKGTQLVFCDLGVSKIHSQRITLDSTLLQDIDSLASLAKEKGLFLHKNEEDSLVYVQILNTQTNEIITNAKEIQYKQDENHQNTNIINLKSNQEIIKEYSAQDLMGEQSSFNVYGDILQKLVKNGIPQSEIAFIGDAKSDKEKQKLFAKVNQGEIRILIGSTQKMGAGTNVQQRVVAMHELTCPYRPSDLEQRQGRVIRQGNLFYEELGNAFQIKSFRYATESTLDARMYQINESKLKAINMLKENNLNGKRELEAIDEAQIAISEMKAEATGNPFIIEKNRISLMLEKELAMYRAYQTRIIQTTKELEHQKNKQSLYQEQLQTLRELLNLKNPTTFSFFGISYDKNLKDKDKSYLIQKKLNDYIKSPENDRIIADFNSFKLGFKINFLENKTNLHGYLKIQQQVLEVENLKYNDINTNSTLSFSGLLSRLNNFFNEMPNLLESKVKEIEFLKEDIASKEQMLNTHKNEDYPRKPLIEVLRVDKKNIDTINSLMRDYKREKGIKLTEDSKEIVHLLPKYKTYLNQKNQLDMDLFKEKNNIKQEEPNLEAKPKTESEKPLENVEKEKTQTIEDLNLKVQGANKEAKKELEEIQLRNFSDKNTLGLNDKLERVEILSENQNNISKYPRSRDILGN